MKHLTLFVIVMVLCPSAAWADSVEPTRFPKDRQLDCRHIRLELDVDVEHKHVDAMARIDLTALRDTSSITFDAVDLKTDWVRMSHGDGAERPVEYVNDGVTLTLSLSEPLSKGDTCSVSVKYAVDDPESGLNFFGPTENEPDVPYVVWSQGESVTNRYWFPCFDQPNEKQTSELIVTCKDKFKVSSNGRMVSRDEDSASGRVTYHWVRDKPHSSYLISMIVGEFDVERDSWRGKPVEYWVHPEYKDEVQRSFKNTKRMLDFFSDRIGVEYPWDRYAQICCEGFGGGMENTSATTLGNRALLDKRAAIDDDSDGLISHELAHQWWGDLLTCCDWAHIWLNEGFATYFEALWDEQNLGADEFAYNMYRKAGRALKAGAKRPIVDRAYEHSRDMFDDRAYPKGGWVLHMLRNRLGDDLFWKTLNKYATDNAYLCVETVDLRRAVEAVSQLSFEQFFHDWTERPGHPEVTVSFKWLDDDKLAKIDIKQTQEADAFHFPLTFEFRSEDGAPATLTVDVDEKEQSLYFPLAQSPELFRVDPGQTVLMDLKEKKGRQLWANQLQNDPDVAARIRAAEHFGESDSAGDRAVLAEALANEKFWGVQREIATALAKTGGDVARDALIAGLKFENPKARRACAEQLANFHEDAAAIDAVRPIVVNGDASYNVESSAIETYAKLGAADAFDVLMPVLKRDSRLEVIRRAALEGMGKLPDERVIPLLTEWTKPDRPRRARPAAIGALADATKNMHLDDDVLDEIVETIIPCLNDTGRYVRRSAVGALGSLSEPGRARSALPKLRMLANSDESRWLRSGAKRTIKAIESGEPAQVQLAELRDELKDAKKANEELRDRVEKLEAEVSASDREPPKPKELATSASHAQQPGESADSGSR